MDPSQGCSSHRPEPHFSPLPAPRPGVREQGRGEVSEVGGGGLLTPRARSCGCASCSTFLRLRLRLPPGSLRSGVSCRANATRPGQHPGQHPAAPREPLRASWAWCREEPGTRAVQNIPSGPHAPPPPVLRRFPVLRYLRASWSPPWPCPHRARGVAALAPGSPSLLLSGRRQPWRAAAPRGRRWGRAGGSHQGTKPLFDTLPPSPGGARSPQPSLAPLSA